MKVTVVNKLIIAATTSALLVISLLFMFHWTKNSAAERQALISAINAQIVNLRSAQVDANEFLLDPSDQHADDFMCVIDETRDFLTSSRDNLNHANIPTITTNKVIASINHYKRTFNSLLSQQKVIGYHPKDGAYGELRRSVHDVEKIWVKSIKVYLSQCSN